jgi:DNA-binding transcriptional regulator YiaG
VNPNDLTPAERVLLQRRRSGHSQREAAKAQGVTLYQFRKWETGEEDPPRVSLGELRPHEVCFLRRRRAGISVQDLAAELDVTPWWLTQMEYGRQGCQRLLDYWGAKEKPWRPRRAVT